MPQSGADTAIGAVISTSVCTHSVRSVVHGIVVFLHNKANIRCYIELIIIHVYHFIPQFTVNVRFNR